MTNLCGRPITYGDTEQIKALKKMRRVADKEEQQQKERKAKGLKMYRVEMYCSGYITRDVEAANQEEAREVAIQELDVNTDDFQCDIETVELIK